MYFLWQKVIRHILLLKKALKYGLILKKAHRTILFKQKNGFSNMIVKVLIIELQQKMILIKIWINFWVIHCLMKQFKAKENKEKYDL